MAARKLPTASTADTQICVRVSPRLIERADALIPHVSAASGRSVVRADVWREALLLGLAALERQQGRGEP